MKTLDWGQSCFVISHSRVCKLTAYETLLITNINLESRERSHSERLRVYIEKDKQCWTLATLTDLQSSTSCFVKLRKDERALFYVRGRGCASVVFTYDGSLSESCATEFIFTVAQARSVDTFLKQTSQSHDLNSKEQVKRNISNSGWEWVSQTHPEDVSHGNILTAYRVRLSQCQVKGFEHMKNCKGNPNCYNCLGEKAWMEKNLDEDLKDAVLESSRGIRPPGTYIGLKKGETTCYANTFLQVWFQNPEFRRGIFDWTDSRRGQANSFGDRSSETYLPPTTVLDHLQLIFALLLFSDRHFIDPSSFIECLQLDTSLQQDAQEFAKRFMSLLEEQLPVKDCYNGLNLIQHEFVGRYEYVTRCNGCGQQSRSGSKFYEIDLNIKSHSTLDECLKEFLQEEILEGVNQYSCQYCLKKQDAVRRIRLIDLPSTLNFQLLRFVIDKQTRNKKKLLSYIQFPQTLDMNAYFTGPDGLTKREGDDMVYDLVSVLIHRDPGAHSSHYVAVIKDCSSQETYRFNDEEVEKLSSDRFLLGNEEDTDGSKSSQKKPQTAKGFLSSRNAYMLVYRRRRNGIDLSAPETIIKNLSPHLQALVRQDNERYQAALREQLDTKRFYIGKDRKKQELVKKFYEKLQKASDIERDNSFEWVITTWLRSWMAADCMRTVPPINNSSLLCPHEKLHPDNVKLAKALPKAAADMIFEKFGGCLRLPCLSSVCRQCVEERCRIIHTKAMLTEDNKTIALLLKFKDSNQESDTSYWVGKKSLRNWRQMAEKALELSMASVKEDVEYENEPENGGKDMTIDNSSRPNHVTFSPSCTSIEAVAGDSGDTAGMENADAAIGAAPGDDEMEEEEDLFFNEDLLCSVHGNLSPDISIRRSVPQDIWMILKKYFPKAREFIYQSPVCHFCKSQDEQVKFFKEKDKAAAAEQRQNLVDLYLEKKRPTWSMPDVLQVNIVSCAFLEEWRKFISAPAKQPVISVTDNASLLCNHGRFMYDVERDEALYAKYAFIWPHEWSILLNYVTADIEITVTRNPDEAGGCSLVISPGICVQCCRERQQEEYSSEFTYTIYVCRVTDENLFALSLNSMNSTTVTATASDGEGLTDDADIVNENGKRMHSNSDGSSAEKVTRLEAPSSMEPMQRSARKGRVQDEIKLDVSSTQTLRDLKMQLVKAFSVITLHQHLYLDGVELCNEDATLEQLSILPGSVLYLQADEPSGETTFMDVSPVNPA